MMGRAAPGVLLAVTMGLMVGPALAVFPTCPDEDAGGCGPDCTLCLCCSHVPRTTLPLANGEPAASPAGRLGADSAVVPPAPPPRAILHVPKLPPPH